MKKRWKKLFKRSVAGLLAGLMAFSTPLTSIADYWQGTVGDWQYVEESAQGTNVVKSGWRKIQDIWYHFNSEGKMDTGWLYDTDGNTYYLNQYGEGIEGSLRTGWYQSPITKKWYYFNQETEGVEGALRTGWYQDSVSQKWYWLEPSDGVSKGVMQTGWIYDGTAHYYLGTDGAWIPGYTEYVSDDDNYRHSGSSGSGGSTQKPSGTIPEGGSADPEVQIVNAKETVLSFDNETEEGLEELKNVYEGIIDYWTDNKGTESTEDDEYNVVVTNENPLYSYILDGTYQEDYVIYIPACEYFPTGVSLIYKYHDDAYEADMTYASENYEVIHTQRATLGDLIADEISFSSDTIDEENPIAFVWSPEYETDTMEVEESVSTFSLLRSSSLARSSSSSKAETEANWGAEKTIKGAGLQLHNLSTAFLPTCDFSNIHKGQIGLKMNGVVLYDKDGKQSTKYDRIVLSGELGLKDITPNVALEWDPTLSDPLPKQFLAKLSYVEENKLKVTAGGEIGNLSNIYKAIKKSCNSLTHNNKRSVFGMDIEGVDMGDSVILAAVGVNVAAKTVKLNIKSLRDQSIKLPVAPTFLILFTLDINGKISTTVVGEYTSTTYIEKGVNVQKKGYIGDHGTCAENQGQKNYEVLGRNVNIYDLKAKSKTEKNKKPVTTISVAANGKAEFNAGVGAGFGMMMAGIIPVMIKGTVIGLEAEAEVNGKGTMSSETGPDRDGEFSGSAALISDIKLLLKLTAKTFLGNPGVQGEWTLGKYTWLQLNFTTQKVKGQVFGADDDRDNSNNTKLADAVIEFTKKNTLAGTSENKTVTADADGKFEVSGLADGDYVMKVSKDFYLTYEKEVKVTSDMEEMIIFLDAEGIETQISGEVSEADSDTNAANNEALENVKVTLTKIGSSTTAAKQMMTGADGTYKFEKLPVGLYEIVFEKNNYITVRDEVRITSSAQVYNAEMELISNSYAGEGTAKGTIINALTGRYVGGGIKLTVTEGRNISDADVVTTTETNQNGKYVLKLPAGIYTIWLEDSNEPKVYRDDSFVIKVLGGSTIDDQNGEMTPILGDEEIRIVLTWGSTPRDLDSHITGPNGNGGRFHVYYSNKNYYSGSERKVGLDVDDTSSYGPETVTIYSQENGVYRYAIHNYTNRGSSNSMALANSGAYIKVYKNGEHVRTFAVPNKAGTVWNVFDYDSTTGEITPLNTMSYQSMPAYVGSYTGSRMLMVAGEEELKDYELANRENAEVKETDSNATYAPSEAEIATDSNAA